MRSKSNWVMCNCVLIKKKQPHLDDDDNITYFSWRSTYIYVCDKNLRKKIFAKKYYYYYSPPPIKKYKLKCWPFPKKKQQQKLLPHLI